MEDLLLDLARDVAEGRLGIGHSGIDAPAWLVAALEDTLRIDDGRSVVIARTLVWAMCTQRAIDVQAHYNADLADYDDCA